MFVTTYWYLCLIKEVLTTNTPISYLNRSIIRYFDDVMTSGDQPWRPVDCMIPNIFYTVTVNKLQVPGR